MEAPLCRSCGKRHWSGQPCSAGPARVVPIPPLPRERKPKPLPTRRRKEGEGESIVVSARLSPELERRLVDWAAAHGMQRGGAVEVLIEKGLDDG